MQKIKLIFKLPKLAKCLFGLEFFFIFFAIPQLVTANQRLNLSVSPSNSYVYVDSEKEEKITLILENLEAFDLKITPQLFDFKSNNLDGQPVISQLSNFKQINFSNSAIQFNQSFILNSLQKQSVDLVVSPQANFLKEYYLSIIFLAESLEVESQKIGSKIIGGLGSNIIILTSSEKKDYSQLKIVIDSWPKIIDSFSSKKINLMAVNSGKSGALIDGLVKVKNIFNQKEILSVELATDLVLADSQRKVKFKINDQIKDDLFLPRFLFGRYQLETLSKNNHYLNNQSYQAEVWNFYVFPVKLLFLILGLLIIWLMIFQIVKYQKKLKNNYK